jgi:hypothetical protein
MEFFKDTYTVAVYDEKKMFEGSYKKMRRDGIQCCHVMKIADRLDLVLVPDSFVRHRWTIAAGHDLKLATGHVTPAFLALNKSPNKSCVFSKLNRRAQLPFKPSRRVRQLPPLRTTTSSSPLRRRVLSTSSLCELTCSSVNRRVADAARTGRASRRSPSPPATPPSPEKSLPRTAVRRL